MPDMKEGRKIMRARERKEFGPHVEAGEVSGHSYRGVLYIPGTRVGVYSFRMLLVLLGQVEKG